MMAVVFDSAIIASKFRGCLVGSILGDCLGSPFEGDTSVSKVVLQKYFDKLEGPYFPSPVKPYTDDTAMTKCVAESLVAHGGFDAKDMAKRFVVEYFANPKRGYGSNVAEVFYKLRAQGLEEVWKPAREQFEGSGSYGNGGAMRVAPVALFCHNNYRQMLETAAKTTQLTHTHSLGVNGALLQCIAILLSLELHPQIQPVDVKDFISQLVCRMSEIEAKDESNEVSYVKQLGSLPRLLLQDGRDVGDKEVQMGLGTSVAALYSVPTAIYCFLRAQKPIPLIQTDDPFRRTLQYAISLGGDTDTIASMAGAIAGAYYGYESINVNVQRHCEAADSGVEWADHIMCANQHS